LETGFKERGEGQLNLWKERGRNRWTSRIKKQNGEKREANGKLEEERR